MVCQLLIQNRQTGRILDCSNVAESITCSTERTGSPGTLKCTLVDSSAISLGPGDPVRFAVDGGCRLSGVFIQL